MTSLAQSLQQLLGKTIIEIEVHTGSRRESFVLKFQDGTKATVAADCSNDDTTYFDVEVK